MFEVGTVKWLYGWAARGRGKTLSQQFRGCIKSRQGKARLSKSGEAVDAPGPVPEPR